MSSVGTGARRFVLDIGQRLGEPARMAGTFFPPTGGGDARPVLVCLPGGTYTRDYFDLDVPGLSGYSFARHAASLGFAVVALDHLGTGESSRPERDIDLGDQARAVAAAADELTAVTGRRGPLVAVAHSMGGYVAMLQQSAHRTYDALAILGTTNQYVATLGLDPDTIAAAGSSDGRSALLEQMLAGMPDRYLQADRRMLQSWFYLDDVPDAVVAADRTTLTVVPRRCGAEASLPGATADAAATIDVPVLLAYGEVDVSPSVHAEATFYPRCPDLTLYLLGGSGHCHNFASTRTALWDRLIGWVAMILGG